MSPRCTLVVGAPVHRAASPLGATRGGQRAIRGTSLARNPRGASVRVQGGRHSRTSSESPPIVYAITERPKHIAQTAGFPDYHREFKKRIEEMPDGELRQALLTIAKGGGAELEHGSGIYHLGYHSPHTFGASPYLIVRPEGGNVMVDCPSFRPALGDAIAQLGGVRWIFLTHTDDMDGHDDWAKYFKDYGCQRILHEADVRQGWNRHQQRTWECEVHLGATRQKLAPEATWANGPGPVWLLDGDPELQLQHVPGHSSGSVALMYGSKAVFTGDHIMLRKRLGKAFREQPMRMGFSPRYARNAQEQVESVRALAQVGPDFEYLLPGHGRPFRFNPGEFSPMLKDAAALMDAVLDDGYSDMWEYLDTQGQPS